MPVESSITKFINYLEELQKAEFIPHSEALKTAQLVEEFLFLAYDFSKNKEQSLFEKGNTQKIGHLLAEALPAIGYYICRTILRFESESADIALTSREGLQFLFDNFSDFPASKEHHHKLKQEFDLFKEVEGIAELDKYLNFC